MAQRIQQSGLFGWSGSPSSLWDGEMVAYNYGFSAFSCMAWFYEYSDLGYCGSSLFLSPVFCFINCFG